MSVPAININSMNTYTYRQWKLGIKMNEISEPPDATNDTSDALSFNA